MSDAFERRLADWMAEHDPAPGEVDRLLALELPPRPSLWRAVAAVASAAATVVVSIVIGAGLLGRPFLGVGAPASLDPRAARCGVGGGAEAVTAFPIAHAADYHKYLPAMLLAPELDRPDPALVVVLGDVPAGLGRNDPSGRVDPGTKTGTKGTVCIVVGDDPASAEVNLYENVDLTGVNKGP
jgi:hypothetical protein